MNSVDVEGFAVETDQPLTACSYVASHHFARTGAECKMLNKFL